VSRTNIWDTSAIPSGIKREWYVFISTESQFQITIVRLLTAFSVPNYREWYVCMYKLTYSKLWSSIAGDMWRGSLGHVYRTLSVSGIKSTSWKTRQSQEPNLCVSMNAMLYRAPLLNLYLPKIYWVLNLLKLWKRFHKLRIGNKYGSVTALKQWPNQTYMS
jgi:hypothetical protein